MSLTPATRLEAVNVMLANVGQSPVSSLEVSGFADVANAKSTLDQVSRSVQKHGWAFNTEDDYSLALNTDNKVPVPPNALACDPMASECVNAVPRGGFLYDKKNHTFTFTKSVKCRIVFYLEFEDLPACAREYIAVRAARIFQQNWFSSSTLDGFTSLQELQAWTDLLSDDVEQGDYNILNGSESTASILRRDEPWVW